MTEKPPCTCSGPLHADADYNCPRHRPRGRNYPIDGNYDLDLRSSGAGWTGTFRNLVQQVVNDITDDGPYSPVEVTLEGGQVITGKLDVWMGDGSFTITGPGELPRIVEVDEVVRFRA